MRGTIKMDFNYPVSISLKGKKVVVIGGGSVAQRKVKDLLKTKCSLEVYASEIDPGLARYMDERKVKYFQQDYSEEQIHDAFMVIASTDDRDVNKLIPDYCNEHNILVNVVDGREDSNFLVNSIIRRGDLTIAVSTNGKAPALAARVMREIDQIYPVEYAIFIDLLFEMREIAKDKISDQKKRSDALREVANFDVLEDLNKGNIEEVRSRMEECVLSYMD